MNYYAHRSMIRLNQDNYILQYCQLDQQYVADMFAKIEMYRSPNIVRVIKSRRLRWAGHVARMEEGRSAFKILTGRPKPTGKRPSRWPRRRWENNVDRKSVV